MKKPVHLAFIALTGIFCILPAISAWPQAPAREAADGPYTFVYQIFRGDYRENAPVYARLTAALQRAGMKPTRSIGIFLDDPKTTPVKDLRCICGVVIDEKDWPGIVGLDDSFQIQHIQRATRIIAEYPIKGPESYVEGGALCYPELVRYVRQKGYTPLSSFEVYDSARRVISYVASAVELEASSIPAARPSGNPDWAKIHPASWPVPDWQTSTPEAQGMDSRQLARILASIPTMYDLDDIDSFLVTRHGKIVSEVYFSPNRPGDRHELHSVTKTVLAALVGAAIQTGSIHGLDDRVLSYFPDSTFSGMSPQKGSLTIGHLLNMASGLDFQEFPLNSSEATHGRMLRSKDWARFALELPMTAAPGARFNYADGDVSILAAVLRKATGRKISDFAARGLFDSLGISNFEWREDPQGNTMGNDGLFLTSRDLARIGYLYLRNGMWNGKRILPEYWARETSKPAIKTGWPLQYYSMLWWVDKTGDIYAANGSAGQMLIVIPRQDIVAVVTAKHPMSLDTPSFTEAANALILPAVKSDSALPEDPPAFKILADRIAQFQTPTGRAVPMLPDTAKLVSGRIIDLEPNGLGLKWLKLHFDSSAATAEIFSDGKTFSIPIGLDGVSRISDRTARGLYASKGRWEDQQTFVVDSRILEGDFSDHVRLSFQGDRVNIAYIVSDELWGAVAIRGLIRAF